MSGYIQFWLATSTFTQAELKIAAAAEAGTTDNNTVSDKSAVRVKLEADDTGSEERVVFFADYFVMQKDEKCI